MSADKGRDTLEDVEMLENEAYTTNTHHNESQYFLTTCQHTNTHGHMEMKGNEAYIKSVIPSNESCVPSTDRHSSQAHETPQNQDYDYIT